MLKKIKNEDLDEVMQFWKNQVAKSDKKINVNNFSQEYTKVKDALIKNLSSTVIYTEDGNLNGCISFDKVNNQIDLIIVKKEIRREGIGSILIDNLKKDYNQIKAKIDYNDRALIKFFESNGFKIYQNDNNEDKVVNTRTIEYVWNKNKNKSINLIYFDNSIEKEETNKHNLINYYPISIKQNIKKDLIDMDNIKTYMKIRKIIESSMKADIVLLYIDYNEYYEFMDDIIKDLAKINKVELRVIVCEPFSIEGVKKMNVINKIENAYKDYQVYKIDCIVDFSDDITVNQIFQKRSEIVLKKIEEIALS